MQREKKTMSGPLLEIDVYPVFRNGYKIPSRAPKTKRSTPEQIKYNQNQATKKLVRLVNANFSGSDIFLHQTYDPTEAPQDEKQAYKDVTNYIRRVKTARATELKKLNGVIKALPDSPAIKEYADELRRQKKQLEKPLKYIYVIEESVYQKGLYAGSRNYHIHMFVTGGLSRNKMERIWGRGARTNADRFQPETFGPEAAAVYISKNPQGSKRFCVSKNLDKPKTPKPRDGHMSKRDVERIARERADDAEYWERRYKGYRFLRCFARYNAYNGYWYVSITMYKTSGDPPRWRKDEWLDY